MQLPDDVYFKGLLKDIQHQYPGADHGIAYLRGVTLLPAPQYTRDLNLAMAVIPDDWRVEQMGQSPVDDKWFVSLYRHTNISRLPRQEKVLATGFNELCRAVAWAGVEARRRDAERERGSSTP